MPMDLPTRSEIANFKGHEVSACVAVPRLVCRDLAANHMMLTIFLQITPQKWIVGPSVPVVDIDLQSFDSKLTWRASQKLVLELKVYPAVCGFFIGRAQFRNHRLRKGG
jgi:hypothetical protein